MNRMVFRTADSSDPLDLDPVVDRQGAPVDLARVLGTFARQRWVFATWMAIGLALGLLYLATTPKTFQAWGTVMILGPETTDPELMSIPMADNMAETAVENALQVMRSQRLALDVVERLSLEEEPAFTDLEPSLMGSFLGDARESARWVLARLGVSRPTPAGDPASEEDAQAALREETAAALQKGLDAFRVGRSSAVTLGYETQSPELSAAIVNAYVAAYSDDILETNLALNEQAAGWLAEELTDLRAEADQAGRAVEQFRREKGIVESADGGFTTGESVSRINDELSVALADQARARALVETYEDVLAAGPEALDGAGARTLLTAEDASQAQLRDIYDALVARRASIVANFGEDHQEAQRLAERIDRAAEALFQQLQQNAAGARGALDVATGRVESLREALAEAVEANADTQANLVQLRALEQRAETAATLYETLILQAQRADQLKTLPIANVRTLSQASIPLDPASPGTTRTLGLALILGLMAAVLHAAFREWRDRNIRTGEDVTDGLHVRFLGYLPLLREVARRRTPAAQHAPLPGSRAAAALPPARPVIDAALPALTNPHSNFAETLRTIRLTSEMQQPGREGRVIGVTSVRPGEGKSTTALNLAAVLALGGRSTLLIDVDPRRAGLSARLGLVGRRGLASAVLGGRPIEECASRLGEAGLNVIGCEGSYSPSFTFDLLGSQQMSDFLEQARGAYDFIVLDLAPLGPIVDTRLVLPFVDQAILVAEWGRTPRTLLNYTLAQEPELRSKLLGVVLNRVDLRRLKRYSAPDLQTAYAGAYGSYFERTP